MKHTIDFQPKLFTALKNYDRRKFTADLMAGIIVGIVALPLAIAFGIASGVSPEKGLITAIIGGFIVSFLGGSNVQIGGPTGAFIVIVAGIISQYGIEGLAIATVMAGIILVLLGLFKLGVVIKFIPYPIIVGFTAGIALTIFSTQIKDLFGLRIDGAVPEDFIGKWAVYFQHFDTTNLWALGIGLVSILIILLTPKVSRKIPGSLAAIILVTVASYLLKRYCGIDTIETIGDRYSINPAIPAPAGFSFNLETIRGLLPPAFTIAMLGAIESLLSATVADGVTGDRLLAQIGRSEVHHDLAARHLATGILESRPDTLLALLDGVVRQSDQIESQTAPGEIDLDGHLHGVDPGNSPCIRTDEHIIDLSLYNQAIFLQPRSELPDPQLQNDFPAANAAKPDAETGAGSAKTAPPRSGSRAPPTHRA